MNQHVLSFVLSIKSGGCEMHSAENLFLVVFISKEKMPQATADLCRHRVQCFRVVHIGSQPGRRFVMIY